MTATLIDGKAIAAEVREEVRQEVESWIRSGGPVPYLAVVLVGDDPSSASYVRGKENACAHAGIRSDTLRYPAEISERQILATLGRLNADPAVSGILVQLPLPDHIDEDEVIRAISPEKDVDGFHPESAGRLLIGQAGFVPATPAGIIELLRRSQVEICGKRAVIIGRSNIVGKPLANLLMRKGTDATVTVCHSRTEDLPRVTREADILIAAIGRAGFVTDDMVKPGATVIDVGINRVPDASRDRGYRIVGDVVRELRDVVEGQIDRGLGSDLAEESVHALLAELVVERGDDGDRIAAERVIIVGGLQGRLHVGLGCTGQDERPPRGLLGDHADDFLPLLEAESGELARAPVGVQPADAMADQEMKRICKEDGMCAIRAWWCFYGVRFFAGFAASPENRKPVIEAP